MVDGAKVEQLLGRLQEFHTTLSALASTPRAVLLANGDKIGSAKYHFVVAIECAIDVANHIIASEGLRIPTSNADSFAVLGEASVLQADFVDRLRAMARFRNRLVHLYWEVDDELVADYLVDGLPDIHGFAVAIGRWMGGSRSVP